MTIYQAYELVDLEGRSILKAPAPGLEVMLVSEFNRPLIWTVQKPTTPGWYWWRNSQAYRLDLAPEITMVFMRRKLLRAELMNGNKFTVMTMGGEWAGPLEPPKGK